MLPVVVLPLEFPGATLMLCEVVLISAWVSALAQGQAPAGVSLVHRATLVSSVVSTPLPCLHLSAWGGELGFASASLVMGDADLL